MATGDVNYLRTNPIGKITRWESKKSSQLLPVTFPGKDSGETEAVDAMGIIAYINIEGRLTGKFEAIQDVIYAIQNILDGDQVLVSTLYSPFVSMTDGSGQRRQGAQGVTTSTSSFALADNTADFDVQGIQIGDKVKNLSTGEITTVDAITTGQILNLVDDIFTSTGQAYAVSANIGVKILSFDVRWELPGLSYCNYTLSVMQVNES